MSHSESGQYWVSEDGAQYHGGKHGYFVTCACGEAICVGPAPDHIVPRPERMKELDNKPFSTEDEGREYTALYESWAKEQRVKFEENRMWLIRAKQEAIKNHAQSVPKGDRR
jgi:hypothetical protein